jgi:protein phosphatase
VVKSIDPRRIETASLTDVGRRRASNQDAFGGLLAPSGARLLVVADGMGGHAGGETASRLAVETVEEFVGGSAGDPTWLLRTALEAANRRVLEQARSDPSLTGMGTTGVALLFQPGGSAWVAHVGDSRAYRLRDGRLEQLTPDHSLVAEFERRGLITAEEARVHPRRNEVLRCIGVDSEVDVDVAPVEVRSGDQYLLCSDGLCGVLTDEEIAAELLRAAPEAAARRLVDAANERGGPDNITVQIARIPAAAGRVARTLEVLQAQPSSRPRVAVGILAVLLALALLWTLLPR